MSNQRGFAHILLILILIIGLGVGVYLVQKQTNLFSKAFVSGPIRIPTVSSPVVEGIAISGVVFKDNNRNGQNDSGDTLMSGEVVILQDNNCTGACKTQTTHEIQRFVTNSNGFYTFNVQKPGNYRITHYVPSGYVKTNDDSAVQNVTKNLTQNFGIAPFIKISGIVFDDSNGNGQMNPPEGLMMAQEVILQDNNCIGACKTQTTHIIQRTTTNSSGKYSFSVPNPGTYRITHYVPSGYIRTNDDSAVQNINKDLTQNFGVMRNSRRVFVTSATYNGNLGGLSGADNKCQNVATAALLDGKWKAWLSDSTTSASSRLYHSPVPYKLLNGSTVANNWADLTDGTLRSPINITELGSILPANQYTWTDTKINGDINSTSVDSNCKNWTNSTASSVGSGFGAWIGQPTVTNKFWTDGGGSICYNNNLNRLYCFEQ